MQPKLAATTAGFQLHTSKTIILSLSIGRCSNGLQVLHHAPVARSPQSGSIPEGLGLRRAGLVVEDLNCIHVFILAPDVLVHHQWWQAGPHNGSDEGAQLDHIAESLRVGLRNCDEPVRQDGKLTDAARHNKLSFWRPYQITFLLEPMAILLLVQPVNGKCPPRQARSI